MRDKKLSPLQKILGDAYPGKCQKRYRHKKDFQFFKEGESVGHLIIDVKLPNEELKRSLLEFKEMAKADKIVLHWTAVKGFVNEEVNL